MCLHDHRGPNQLACGCARQAVDQCNRQTRRSALGRIASGLALLSSAPAFLTHAVRAATGDGPAFDVVSSGKVVGALTLAPAGPRVFSLAYEYNDRGRGPKVVGSLSLAGDGTLAGERLSGIDYYKNSVDERFSIAGVARVGKINMGKRTRFPPQGARSMQRSMPRP
jgi:hypothetical protein